MSFTFKVTECDDENRDRSAGRMFMSYVTLAACWKYKKPHFMKTCPGCKFEIQK